MSSKTNEAQDFVKKSPSVLRDQIKYCNTMLKALKRHPDSGPFLHPVDPVALNVPDYFDIIKNPMDLTTLQTNLNNGKYADNPDNFISDTRLIFTNCYTYNGINSQISEMAKALEKVFENMLKKMPQEGDHSSFGSKSKTNHPNTSKKHPKKITLKGDLKFCKEAINEMLKKKYSNINIPFLQPVDPIALGVPDYYTIITNPMDLSTLRKKLESGEYENADQFETDCRLIFSNCYIYNHPDSEVYKMGQRLEEVFNNKWKHRPLPKEPSIAADKKVNKKKENMSPNNHSVLAHSPLRQSTTIKVETNEYSSESDFSDGIEKQQNKEPEQENIPINEVEPEEEFIEYNDAEEEDDDDDEDDEDDEDKNADAENLKREINQLQKTLQICTERLSLLLEKKSQAVARKAKKEKKLKLAGKSNKILKQKIPKLKTSKIIKSSKVSKSKSKDEKGIQDIFEEENEIYSVNKTPSPKKNELKSKQSKQSKSKLKRKNENDDSDSEVSKIPVITMEQKKELSESINNLPPEKLGEVVQIIQESMPLETGQEEIELDIDSFDPTTLYRLYRIVVDNKTDIPVSKRRKIQKSYSKQKKQK